MPEITLSEHNLAERVRQAYILERRLWESRRMGRESHYKPSRMFDGGVCQGHKYVPIWPKIGDFALKNRLEPELLVHRLFAQWQGTISPPHPNYLLSRIAIESYYRASAQDEAFVRQAYQDQLREFELRCRELYDVTDWSEDEIWDNILLDTTLALSALFRYCVAFRKDHKVIAARFAKEAACQYICNQAAYDASWQKLLPADFARRAANIYGIYATRG